jgi:deazaflavin-dependent oxidoreductase (nitroreductase family)
VPVVVLVLGVLFAASGAAEEPPLPEVAAALERIAARSNLDITTIGRRTGKEHTRTIWFVVADGKIIVQAGRGGRTDWYRNLRKTPAVVVRQGDHTFRARATPVTDPARVARIHARFRDKYTSARLLSWVGSSIGQGEPVELTPLSVAVRR